MAAKKLTRKKPGALPRGVSQVIDDARDNGIDTSVLLNDLIDCFGGPQCLAAAMHAEFINAKPGTMMRTRTLEMVQRLVMANTQMELTNLKKPGDLDDAELEGEILRLLQKKEAEQQDGEETTENTDPETEDA